MTIRRQVGLFEANAYVHVFEAGGKRRGILIDPGAAGQELAELFLEREIEPAGLVYTHGHLDHTGGAADFLEAMEKAGYRVQCAIHAADARYLGQTGEATNARLFGEIGAEEFLPRLGRIPPAADVLLKADDLLFGSDLSVFESPGHSPGSILLVSKSEGIVYTGDTLFKMGVGRTDTSDGDERVLEHSLARIFREIPASYRCFPGHGEETTIKAERAVLGYGV
jgi:glyoxylase-like metal-dependent hydrolase (beta-lactamase superfamily II)